MNYLTILEIGSTILAGVKNSEKFLYSVNRLLNLDIDCGLPIKYMHQKVVTILRGKENYL